ncbi:trans-1,2-dihydrobenzene-1,2-diol dehydrogenase isoform X5 [Cricetulus griseus]|uniref:Trans-1,2-dihydrobenzene-1,2-diol dehydrogenase isoform X5 n=1 Tax=Cricetulus griseus TaxID=10029 RepID=A0A9J7G4T2_CRIGR|nr:trans-1,2-dihydrobenzene-1,2-diol dehydrogenase isoform X5 [Cricetulus griseus]
MGHRVSWLNRPRLYHHAVLTASLGTPGSSSGCKGPEPSKGVCQETQYPQGIWLLQGASKGPRRGDFVHCHPASPAQISGASLPGSGQGCSLRKTHGCECSRGSGDGCRGPFSGCLPYGDWRQAGGCLLDLGIYCIQFLSMVFGALKPEKISAMGNIHETGVDSTVSVLLQYPGGLHGSFTCSITSNIPNTAYVTGTKGMAQIHKTWCPMELVVNDEHKEFPSPVLGKGYNFMNGSCLSYEANHVRECLLKGLKESPVVPLAESELMAEILEEARKAIGVTFPQDKC